MKSKAKDAERRLLALQASSAILKSRVEKAAKREEFLLGEIAKTSEQLLCKRSLSPRALYWLFFLC